MRPRASFPLGERGISRFPCEVFPCVLGVCDRAELRYALLYRRIRCCLPPAPTASASRRMCLSRLNTRPVRSPVNASTPLLRAAPHDSGPVWIATPSPYDSFIHYTSPVFTGAPEPKIHVQQSHPHRPPRTERRSQNRSEQPRVRRAQHRNPGKLEKRQRRLRSPHRMASRLCLEESLEVRQNAPEGATHHS